LSLDPFARLFPKASQQTKFEEILVGRCGTPAKKRGGKRRKNAAELAVSSATAEIRPAYQTHIL